MTELSVITVKSQNSTHTVGDLDNRMCPLRLRWLVGAKQMDARDKLAVRLRDLNSLDEALRN